MDMIKILRHYVPECPRCGSSFTGRFIIDNPGKQIEITQKYLNKGERIEVISAQTMPYHNCFCSECDMQWHQDVPLKLYGRNEWQKLCRITGTSAEAAWFNQSKWLSNSRLKDRNRQHRKKIMLNGMKFIAFFFLGIDIYHLPFQKKKKEEKKDDQSI